MSREFALFGGPPAFGNTIPVGQMNFPSWERYRSAMQGIFDREYYTNNGPLARELEERLTDFLGVQHVMCVANATVGLMLAVKALGIDGAVIVPAFTFPATAGSLLWAGARPVFCDVDPVDHQIRPEDIVAVIDDSVQAVAAVNLWGDVCDAAAIQGCAERHGISVYYDSAQAFGCAVGGTMVGGSGSLEVFSFHATKILNSAEGGCVCTNDDGIASLVRNMRSSYGTGASVPVPVTLNGRFSEAQAALALMSLEDFETNREHNMSVMAAYRSGIAELDGLRLLSPSRADRSNHQYVVCEIDAASFGLSRDEVHQLLRAENIQARRYFCPGLHRMAPFETYRQGPLPNTEGLCERVLQLPIGALVSEDDARRITELLASFHDAAGELKARLSEGQGH